MARRNAFARTAQYLCESDFHAVEDSIGVHLPPSLRAHYQLQNGGAPERRYFVSTNGMECEVSHFLSMRYPKTPRDITLESTVGWVRREKLMPPFLVPFAVDSGEDFYCMDIRDHSIVYYSMDHSDEPERAATRIAGSLREFVDGMAESL